MVVKKDLEAKLVVKTQEQLLSWCFEAGLLKREYFCRDCGIAAKYRKDSKSRDGFSWRFINSLCRNHKKYFSIREGSFFKGVKQDILVILRILNKYGSHQPLHSICAAMEMAEKSVLLLLQKFKACIPAISYEENKVGGPNFFVQVDETMLNYKCKSHR
jgi:hypothetical protein